MSLCDSCRHVRRLSTKGGSTILFCRLSETDARFEKYPALPKRSCAGYSADKKSAT